MHKKHTDTLEQRALKIAAQRLQAEGACRYDTPRKCRRIFVDETTCVDCIHKSLLSKAKRELKKEGVIVEPEKRYKPTCPYGHKDCVCDPAYMHQRSTGPEVTDKQYKKMLTECREHFRDDPEEKYPCYDDEDK